MSAAAPAIGSVSGNSLPAAPPTSSERPTTSPTGDSSALGANFPPAPSLTATSDAFSEINLFGGSSELDLLESSIRGSSSGLAAGIASSVGSFTVDQALVDNAALESSFSFSPTSAVETPLYGSNSGELATYFGLLTGQQPIAPSVSTAAALSNYGTNWQNTPGLLVNTSL